MAHNYQFCPAGCSRAYKIGSLYYEKHINHCKALHYMKELEKAPIVVNNYNTINININITWNDKVFNNTIDRLNEMEPATAIDNGADGVIDFIRDARSDFERDHPMYDFLRGKADMTDPTNIKIHELFIDMIGQLKPADRRRMVEASGNNKMPYLLKN